MSKFAQSGQPTNVKSPIKTTDKRVSTHEGALGYERDEQSELFLLAVSNMVGEPTFYESGKARDSRFVQLIHNVTKSNPEWVRRFVPYLRDTMQMRSASLVVAAEYVAAHGERGRNVVDAALQRADEPAEMLAYWNQEHGRSLPAAVKRGVADAVLRLYNEKAVIKYDGGNRNWRMGDVIELVHPRPKAAWQNKLFKYLLDNRHHNDAIPTREDLPILTDYRLWEADPKLPLPTGVTWERLSATRTMDSEAWEAVIPQMGYMALLRNLRNFDKVGIGKEAQRYVMETLANRQKVYKSRQFPIRFFSAYSNLDSLTWGPTLEEALSYSLENIPVLPGKTLILVDCSGSMFGPMSAKSKVQQWEIAALFGSALAKRCEHADLNAYSNASVNIKFTPTASVLKMVNAFKNWPGVGSGTSTYQTLRDLYKGHDRVVILTDEQAFAPGYQPYSFSYPSSYHRQVRDVDFSDIPLIYTFNLAGYKAAHLPSGEKGRYTFGGLTDAGFKVIEILESTRNVGWPF